MKLRLTYSDFDRVGEFFTSLAAVIIGMFIFIAYRFFEVYTLFDKYLKTANMDEGAVMVASKLIALVFIFTMLLISVNIERFKYKRLAEWLGGLITLFINLYFWDVWHTGSIDELVFKVLISIITAAFDVAFAYLFVIKWKERARLSDTERQISENERTISDQQQKLSDLTEQVSDLSAKGKELQEQLSERETKLKETTCPRCGRSDFKNKQAVSGHMRSCNGTTE